jgi:putative transport protein
MADLLADNPLLLLFTCLAVGTAVGSVRIRGFSLGPAAVLFTALALSAWDGRLELPAILGQLGLAVFAYTIGVASGPSFFGALRHALAPMVSVAAVLVAAAALAYGVGSAFGLDIGVIAGIYAGALTNTPALAAATEQLDGAAGPTVGYSVTYLGGVLVMLAAAAWTLRRRAPQPAPPTDEPGVPAPILELTLEVTRRDLPSLGDLAHLGDRPVLFSRVKHEGRVRVPTEDTVLAPGDLVSAIGRPDDVEALAARVGRPAEEHLPLDRRQLDMRRMTLSNRRLSGLSVGELGLGRRFGAVATRVRRGDVDLLAADDIVVMQGDRIRVIAPRSRLPEVARYLGDSERGPGDLNPLGLSLGLAIGLLVGLIPLPAPGGGTFEIGFAAGPLIVGLLLGRAARTGPVVWSVPYTAGLSLQNLGILIFLAAAGSRAGGDLIDSLQSPAGVRIATAGLIVTLTAAVALVVVIRSFGLGGGRAAGTIAGAQTQPAVLAFAQERTQDQRVGLGYAMVFPAAMITKILCAQLLTLL